jgi:hypothetical protein
MLELRHRFRAGQVAASGASRRACIYFPNADGTICQRGRAYEHSPIGGDTRAGATYPALSSPPRPGGEGWRLIRFDPRLPEGYLQAHEISAAKPDLSRAYSTLNRKIRIRVWSFRDRC